MKERAELLKWVGLFAMLVDHAWRFLGIAIPGAGAVGRLAMPCFALALSAQVSGDARWRVGLRVAAFGVAASVLQSWLGGGLVVSVLVGLGVGLAVGPLLESGGIAAGVVAWALLCLSSVGEYGPWLALFVAGMSSRGRLDLLALVGVCGLVVRAGLAAGPYGALLTLFGYLVAGLLFEVVAVSVPRIRGFFMRAYFAQWFALLSLGPVASWAGAPAPGAVFPWGGAALLLFFVSCAFYACIHLFWSLVSPLLKRVRARGVPMVGQAKGSRVVGSGSEH